MKYHLTPTRIAKTEKITPRLDRDVEKFATAEGNVKWGAALENSLAVLQQLNIELTYDPAIPLLGTKEN